MMHAEGYPAVILVLLVTLGRVMGNNFPPVENPPPILPQGVKILDLPPSNSYVQKQVLVNSPKGGEEILIPGSIKNEISVDPRFLSDALKSEQLIPPQDTFEQYYSNGFSAIGPVATPRPDDLEEVYPAQISKTQPFPTGQSGYWIIGNGQDTQFLKDVPSLKVSEVPSLDSVKSVPPEVIRSNSPPDQPGIKQVWVSSPEELHKGYPVVDEQRPQLVDIPYSSYRHVAIPESTNNYVQPPSAVSQLATTIPKSVGIGNIEQIPFPVSDVPVEDLPDNTGWLITKDGTVSQVRHIWIPTSKDSGQFITVPKGDSVGSQTITPKAVPQDVASDTWVLKQDDAYPRFEQRLNPLFPVPANVKEKVSVEKSPIPLDGSVNGLPAIMKSIPWFIRSEAPDVPAMNQASLPWPVNSEKSGTIVFDKGEPKNPAIVQQVFSPPAPVKANAPPPPPVAEAPKKPCPKTPKPNAPNIIISPAARTLLGIRRPIFGRIVRFSNSPNSYYILNPAIRRPLYQYRRPALSPIAKNSIYRFVPSQKVPSASIVIPRTPPRLVYSPYNRLGYIRSAYPWSQLRPFPFAIPTLFNTLPSVPATTGSESSGESGDASKTISGTQTDSAESVEVSEVVKDASSSKEIESSQVEVAETVLNVQTADRNEVPEGLNLLEDTHPSVDEPSANNDTLSNARNDELNDILHDSAKITEIASADA